MALKKILNLSNMECPYVDFQDYYEMFSYVCENNMIDDGKNMLLSILCSFKKYLDSKNKNSALLKSSTNIFKTEFSYLIFKYDCFKQVKNNFYDIGQYCNYNHICVYGNLNVLSELTTENIKLTKENILNICKNGYVDILKWFFDNNCKIKHRKNCMTDAFENGHLNILKFLHSKGIKINYNYKAIEKATKNNHFKLLNWLNSNGYVIKVKKQNLNIVIDIPFYNLMFVTIDFGEMDKLKKMFSTYNDLYDYKEFTDKLKNENAEIIGVYELKNTGNNGENLIYYEERYTNSYLNDTYQMNFEEIVKYYETHFYNCNTNAQNIMIIGFYKKVTFVKTYEIHKIMQDFHKMIYYYDFPRRVTNIKTHENAIYMINDEI